MNTSSSEPLAEQLLQQLQGAPLAQIAAQLGIGAEQAQSAAAMAVPLLLGSMGRNAEQPQGAQALLGALQRDHMQPAAGLDLGGLLGSVLGGGGARGAGLGGGLGGDGAAILGHILGGKRPQAEAQLGQATGLGEGAGKLLGMLAPIVMAFLAQRVRAGGMGAGDLGSMLGQEQTRARSGGSPAGDLLSQVLDQDGNGRVDLGDLFKLGGSLLGGRR